MCRLGFGSAIFHRQITLRRILSVQWAQLSQEFAINSLERRRTFWPQSSWVSVPQNCFIRHCGSRRDWLGSLCLSYRVPVCCMYSRIICRAGTPPSTSRDRAVGSDTLSPISTVGYFATLLAHSVRFSC